MTLKDAAIGSVCTVKALKLDRAVMGRLEALGLTRGTHIRVLNRNRNGSVIIMVRGSRLALGSKIAGTIHADRYIIP